MLARRFFNISVDKFIKRKKNSFTTIEIIILSGPFVENVKFLPLGHLMVVFTPLKIIYTFKFKRSLSLSNYLSCEKIFTDADMNNGEQWLLLGSGNM